MIHHVIARTNIFRRLSEKCSEFLRIKLPKLTFGEDVTILLKLFLSIFLFFGYLGNLRSQEVIKIQDGFSSLDLDSFIEYSIETSLTPISISEVSKLNFNKLENKSANFGYQNAAYWFRISLQELRKKPTDLIFTLNYPLLENVDFYLLEGSTFQKIETGSAKNFNSRSLDHRLLNIKISMSENENKLIYYRVQTKTSLQGGGVLQTLQVFYDSKVSDTFYLGIYYSGISVLIIYNIFIFSFLRERVYFYYFIQQILYVLIQMSLNGTLFYWISEKVPGLDILIIVPTLASLLYFSIKFADSFLSITSNDKYIYIFSKIIKQILLGLFGIGFFIPYKYGVVISIFLIIILLPFLVYCTFYKLYQNYKPSRYYLLANILLILGGIIYAFKTLGILPANLFNEYTFQIGSIFQALLLSLGLAYRIDLMRIENRNLNTNLELQIKETNVLYKNLQKEIEEKTFLQKSNDEIRFEYSETKTNLERAKEMSASLQDLMVQSETKLSSLKKELDDAFFQLIQAEKLSTIGTMVAGIAHDINNPLHFMAGANFNLSKTLNEFKEILLSMVEDSTDEDSLQAKKEFLTRFEKFQKLLDDINLGISRITDISKSMRNATRSDKTISNDVHFVEVCEEALIITASKLKNIEIIKEFSPDFPYLTCNRSQMSQIFMNFLSNSADAIEEFKKSHSILKGKIKIFLRNDQGKISFGVEDNGNGISLEDREKVLKAFYTTKPTGIGTGLGLAICGKIVESHGWKINIDDGLERVNGYGAKLEVICNSKA